MTAANRPPSATEWESDTHTHTHTHIVLETRGAKNRRSHGGSEDEKRTEKAQHWYRKQIHRAIKH